MEVVNTLDIDGTQWEIQDEVARDNINTLAQKTDITTERIWSLDNSFINKVKINNEYFLQAHFEQVNYKGEVVGKIITLQKSIGNTKVLRGQAFGDVSPSVERISVDIDFNTDNTVSVVILNKGIYTGGNFNIYVFGDFFLKII